MQKPADEIKKGLKCLLPGEATCPDDCPYRDLGKLDCKMHLMDDALAYIQQLESDKQQLEGLLNHMNQLRDAAAGRALKMEERVKQLERERDALVEAIRDEGGVFFSTSRMPCRYCDTGGKYTDERCRNCHNGRFFGGFKWRGVKEE